MRYSIEQRRTIQKTEATGDLIGNKIADKIISVSKKPSMELHSKELPYNNDNDNNNNNNNNNNNSEYLEITAHKKRYMSPEEGQQIIDELRAIPKKDAYF